jgi:hypothetical protein
MDHDITSLVEECDRILDTLSLISTENIWQIKAIQLQIKTVRAQLLENQKSLWIKTKNGRAMIIEIKRSVLQLAETIKILAANDTNLSLEALHDDVTRLVNHARKMKTEIRKRGMSIT